MSPFRWTPNSWRRRVAKPGGSASAWNPIYPSGARQFANSNPGGSWQAAHLRDFRDRASAEPTDVGRDKDVMVGEAGWKEHLHLRKTRHTS